jgi:hypothetical protein
LAEISAPLLFENRGARWEALCALCRRALLEGDTQAHEARHAAALALGALVAAPWAADSPDNEEADLDMGDAEGGGSSGAERVQKKGALGGVLKRLRDTGLQKQLLAPLGVAATAEDRYATRNTRFWRFTARAVCLNICTAICICLTHFNADFNNMSTGFKSR